jgi:acyl carrier protein
VLIGRNGVPARSQWAGLPKESDNYRKVRAIETIEALGATVDVRAVDVGDAQEMTILLGEFGQTLPPLRGVIHAAGSVFTSPIEELSLAGLAGVLRAKILGTWVLHQLTQEMELDCFVVFSSGASIWGSKGLAHHAAGNHFLDTLAHYRQALNLPAMSINWGWWAQSNFTAQEEEFLKNVGMEPMPADQALAILEELLRAGIVQKTVSAMNWRLFKPIYEVRRERPFLAEIKPSVVVDDERIPQTTLTLADRLAQARPQERFDLLQRHVQAEVARVLGQDREQPDFQEGLFQMGMDSLMAVELKSRLETSVKQSLPATLTFDYPTIEALSHFLDREVLHLRHTEDPQPTAPNGHGEDEMEYTKLAMLPAEDVKALLDQELAAIDQLVGGGRNE